MAEGTRAPDLPTVGLFDDFLVTNNDDGPRRASVVDAAAMMHATLALVGSGVVAVPFSTVAAMNADLNYAAGTLAIIGTAEPDVTKQGDLYTKSGASGSGSWSFFLDGVQSQVAALEANLPKLPPGDNANNATTPHRYILAGSMTNKPAGGRWILDVFVDNVDQDILQVAVQIPDATPTEHTTWIRRSLDNGATWDPWFETNAYKNANLASTVAAPLILRHKSVVYYHEYNQNPDRFTDNSPLLNTAIQEVTEKNLRLIIDPGFKLGILTSVKWRDGMDLWAYGAEFHKRAEFDTTAMFTQVDPSTGLIDPNKRLTKGFKVRGLNILNDFPVGEGYGFGGDVMDWFCNNAFLEDVYSQVSNQPFPHGHTKTNGRFMVWGGNNVRMNRIVQVGGKGAMVRSGSDPEASGIMAGGMYCNSGEDCLITNFHIESDDDCVINIPKSRGIWNGSTYTTYSDERSDNSIRRVTYAHGRVFGWSGKMGTISVQPNVGGRPSNQAAYDAWLLTWEAPSEAALEDILYFDIKGFHANNAFKVANTRSKGGVRRITFRDCHSRMHWLYNPDTGLAEGNPNAILIESAHVDDENGAQYDHDAPVEDIVFENCTFANPYRSVVEIKTNYQNSTDKNYLQKLLPKNIWIRGGLWDRPGVDTTSCIIDGVSGGGIFNVKLAARGIEAIDIHDVPVSPGFSIENCTITELGGSVVGIKAGAGRPVYGLKVRGNTFDGPNSNGSTVGVKLDGRPDPLSFCEDCLVTDNNFRPQLLGKKIVVTEHSLNRGNVVFDNVGLDMDTRRQIKYNVQTASYILVEGDEYKTVVMNVASDHTLTIPPFIDLTPLAPEAEFPVGAVIPIIVRGAGDTTVTAGPGVTILSRAGFFKIPGPYGRARLENLELNIWLLDGDLVA